MSDRLRIAVVGGALFGFRQPFDGGLEAHTWDLVHGLRRRGHDVLVYGGPGSDGNLGAREMWDGVLRISATARRDIPETAEQTLAQHYAYQRTMLQLARRSDLDVVHLNCVHHLPVAMAPLLTAPVTATLHTPPTAWLEMAYTMGGQDGALPVAVAVSAHLARRWARQVGLRPSVIQNAVDLDVWRPGPGTGGYVAWTGRLVAEKAPHLAIDAAVAAGRPIRLAGPAHDATYFAAEIAPRLGPTVRYDGHLGRSETARLVGGATVALVTPLWDEPFGLVVAEALACGTPVAGTRRGALVDLVGPAVGCLAEPEVGALAAAVADAAGLDRHACRREAVRRFDLDTMIDGYETLFRRVAAGHRSGHVTGVVGTAAAAGSVTAVPLETVA